MFECARPNNIQNSVHMSIELNWSEWFNIVVWYRQFPSCLPYPPTSCNCVRVRVHETIELSSRIACVCVNHIEAHENAFLPIFVVHNTCEHAYVCYSTQSYFYGIHCAGNRLHEILSMTNEEKLITWNLKCKKVKKGFHLNLI